MSRRKKGGRVTPKKQRPDRPVRGLIDDEPGYRLPIGPAGKDPILDGQRSSTPLGGAIANKGSVAQMTVQEGADPSYAAVEPDLPPLGTPEGQTSPPGPWGWVDSKRDAEARRRARDVDVSEIQPREGQQSPVPVDSGDGAVPPVDLDVLARLEDGHATEWPDIDSNPLEGLENVHIDVDSRLGEGQRVPPDPNENVQVEYEYTRGQWKGPGRALQFHLDLLDRVRSADFWCRANVNRTVDMRTAPPTFRQRARLRRSYGLTDAEAARMAVGDVVLERNMLEGATTHYVSHSVSASIEHAALTMDPEPLFPTDIPDEKGLIVLEKPFLVDDIVDDTGVANSLGDSPGTAVAKVPIRAIGWATTTVTGFDGIDRPGIRYCLYDTADSYINASADNDSSDSVAKQVLESLREIGAFMTDMSGWSFGTSWDVAPAGGPSDIENGVVHSSVSVVRRWLLAYFRWIWQRIIIPIEHKTSRAEQKRMTRGGLIDGYVKVLRLRREVEHAERFDRGEESDGFHFDHQWIVRGHWRRVWYSTLGPKRNPDGSFNEESHRRKWIEPHTSGNPFGPLVIGHNVTAAVR